KLIEPDAASVAPSGRILAMVKHPIELGKGRVRGGVVRSVEERREAVDAVGDRAAEAGLRLLGAAEAGVPGPTGTRGGFVLLGREGEAPDRERLLGEVVA